MLTFTIRFDDGSAIDDKTANPDSINQVIDVVTERARGNTFLTVLAGGMPLKTVGDIRAVGLHLDFGRGGEQVLLEPADPAALVAACDTLREVLSGGPDLEVWAPSGDQFVKVRVGGIGRVDLTWEA